MAKTGLLEQVKHNILKENLIKPGAGIVVGVSGGADSVCLLKVLSELKNEFCFKLLAVHVNHCLRGNESDRDQEHVIKLCREWGIPLKVYSVNIERLGAKLKISEEEAGRLARYRIFDQVLKKSFSESSVNASNECFAERDLNLKSSRNTNKVSISSANASYACVCVAHNRNDQAETVMMNILRGSGLDGLCGMSMKSGRIIRPLLNSSRHDIEEYLKENNIPFCIDSSNKGVEYTRNRIRNELFPKIEELFNVNPTNQLVRLSKHMEDEREFLDSAATHSYFDVLISESRDIQLSLLGLRSLSIAIIKRIIRIAWERLSNSRKNLEAVHVERIVSLCKNNHTGKKVQLPGGYTVSVSYERLIFSKEGINISKPYSYLIPKEGQTVVEEANGVLESHVMTKEEFLEKGYSLKNKENSQFHFFDLDKLGNNEVIRTRRDGDRIRPYAPADQEKGSITGEKKLKEYFIDKKVPRQQRDRIPLIASDNKIIWIVGMRTSEEFRAREATKNIWMLSWRNLEEQ